MSTGRVGPRVTEKIGDRMPSDPFRCPRCRLNAWRIFEGERLPDGHVWVRLHCANPGCSRGRQVRRWLADAP